MRQTADNTISDLPDWMRQARRGVDWGLLLVIGFSLMIAQPFITQPSLPHTNASENYVYATATFAAAFQEGRLYPRWSPYALGGYGAPIPHYYPPGAPYFAALIQVLFTGDAAAAVRAAYIIALCAAGAAVYILVTRRGNAAAGLLAAVLYVYSPYVGLAAPHTQGDLSAVMALALVPALLWSADRLLLRNRPLDGLLVALAVAALLFTQPVMALAGAALVAALVSWQRLVHHRVRWRPIAAGLVLGAGMAACFWLPALLERSAVHWRPPEVAAPRPITLAELVASVQQTDPDDLTPAPRFSVGPSVLMFAALGGAAALRFRRIRGYEMLYLACGGAFATAAILLLPGETPLVGLITLCFSIGGSAALRWGELVPARMRRLLLPAALILVWILAVPVWLTPPVIEPFGSTDAPAQIQYELSGYGVAALPPTLSLPSTLPDELPPNRALIESYLSGEVNKISVGQSSATDVRVGILRHSTHGDRFQVSAAKTVVLDVLLAHFPGWQAALNDRLIALSANPQNHLIRVTVPPVRGGLLALELGPTPDRTGAWAITWATLGIALVLTWGRFRRYTPVYEDTTLLPGADSRLVALVLACFVLVMPLAALPDSRLRQQPGYALRGAQALHTRTDAGIGVLAYRSNGTRFRPGDTLELTLYWQAQRPLSENYRVLLYLLDTRTGARWNEQDVHHPGGYPTRRWQTSRYASDSYSLPLNRLMPGGEYQVAIEVTACTPDCLPQNRVTFFDATGRNVGPILYLPSFTVEN